jgi:hypothetical protein
LDGLEIASTGNFTGYVLGDLFMPKPTFIGGMMILRPM